MQAHVLSVFYLISSPYCITSVISISRLLKPQCAYLASSEDIGVIEIHGGNDQGFRIHVSVPDGLRRGSRYWRRRCVCMCVCVCNVLILSFFSRYLSFKTVGSNIKHTKQLFDNHCFLKLHTHTHLFISKFHVGEQRLSCELETRKCKAKPLLACCAGLRRFFCYFF